MKLPQISLARLLDSPKAPLPTGFYAFTELVYRFAGLALLAVLIFWSAFSVVLNAYDYRWLNDHYQTVLKERDHLQIEWGQILLEQSVASSNGRVERAAESLHLEYPKFESIRVVVSEP